MDQKGYYVFQSGECVGTQSKYTIDCQQGRGMFSNVAFARRNDGSGSLVAIKVLRHNERMRRVGDNEEKLLQTIHAVEPSKRRFVVKFLESFMHRKHLCFVFEAMKMNLRQILYSFGRNKGLTLEWVQRYSEQILKALLCLEQVGVVHADVKLDNILVSEDLQVAKLCDFGCAFLTSNPRGESTTTYIVSRFYRAPEVILGLPPQHIGFAIDLWALATCTYELYTGTVMFPGRTNNEMLHLIMQTMGRLPEWVIKRHLEATGPKREPHFDRRTLAFRQVVLTKPSLPGERRGSFDFCDSLNVYQVERNPGPCLSILALLQAHASRRDQARLPYLASLLEQLLVLDPAHRASASQALQSPFFKNKK